MMQRLREVTTIEWMIVVAIVGCVAAIVVAAVDTAECLKRGGRMLPTGAYTTVCWGDRGMQSCRSEPEHRCFERGESP